MDSIVNLVHKNSDRLAKALILLMIIYMSWSVSSAILFFFEAADNDSSWSVDSPELINLPASANSHIELSLLNLFGSVESAAKGSAANLAINAPATRLNLELQGVFRAENKEISTAIVAEKNKVGILYHLGDSLPGNATLFDIFDDHILIKRGNSVEKLMFDDSAYRAGPGAAIVKNPQSERSGSRSALRGTNSQQDLSRLIPYVSTSDVDGISKIEEYKARFESDPESVLTEFGLSPVEEGSAGGYTLQPGPTSSFLKRSGLREGDTILSVNGNPVGNSATDSSLINQSLGAKRLRVEVKRGSRKFFVTVPVPGK